MEITIETVEKVEVTTDAPGYLRVYVRVTATEGTKSITEEFHIGRQVVGRRVVTNAQGWPKTAAGIFIDPTTLDPSQPEPEWEYEPVVQDLRAEVLTVLRQTIRHRLDTNWKGDAVRMRDKLSLGDRTALPLNVRRLEGMVVN